MDADSGTHDETSSNGQVSALLGLAFLPSLIAFAQPVLDADVAAMCFGPEGSNFEMLVSSGRPALALLLAPLLALTTALGLPAGAYVFIAFHVACFGLWLAVSHRVMSRLMGGPMRSALLHLAVSLHFHAYEFRLIGGGAIFPAIIPILLALGAASAVLDRGFPRWRAVAIVAGATLLGLNVHQAGAFIATALLGLMLTEILLRPGPLDRQATRRTGLFAAAFAAGCVVYALEMAVIVKTVGLIQRPMAFGPVGAMVGFLKKLALWLPAPLPMPGLARAWLPVFAAGAAIMAAAAWRAAGRGVLIDWRRRAVAATAVAAGGAASMAPTIATSGAFTSRVLAGALIAAWGGLILFLAGARWHGATPAPRARRAAVAIWIALAAACHVWGFALDVWLKGDGMAIARETRKELAAAWKPGDPRPVAYLPQYITRDIAWSDAGTIFPSVSWGLEAAIIGRAFDDGLDLRAARATFLDEKLPPAAWADLPGGDNVRRAADSGADGQGGAAMINGGAWVQRQMETVDRFRRPWSAQTRLPLGSLIRYCSTETTAVVTAPWDTAENAIELLVPGGGAELRISVTARRQNRPWAITADFSAKSPVKLRCVAVGSDGTSRSLGSVQQNQKLVTTAAPPGTRPVLIFSSSLPGTASPATVSLTIASLDF